ncbi:heavy-metal-associated domain-containing protein [Polaromonas sp.]|uniref:heavy-metal-associated domain-containing protein n=1 Tax=Polaromonas sp. TaxID=1869339 RepID=UPI003266881E
MQEFLIPSMTCGGCASRITQTLHNLDANAMVEVDLPNKTVRVDSSQESAAVEAALKGAGYPPVEVQSVAIPATAGTGTRRSGCCCG